MILYSVFSTRSLLDEKIRRDKMGRVRNTTWGHWKMHTIFVGKSEGRDLLNRLWSISEDTVRTLFSDWL
jgi:hypothetical protein